MKNSDDTVVNRIRDLPATTCPVCLYSDSGKNILKFGTPYVEHSLHDFRGIFTSAIYYNVRRHIGLFMLYFLTKIFYRIYNLAVILYE